MATKKKPSFEKVSQRATKNGVTYGCSVGKDDKGYFCYTHRARGKSYPTKAGIPVKELKFIESTG